MSKPSDNHIAQIAKTIRQTLRANHGAQWNCLGAVTDALVAQQVLFLLLGQCSGMGITLEDAQQYARDILAEFEAA